MSLGMSLLGGHTFRHGIHPPEFKDATRGLAIHQFPFADLLIVPLSQHIGRPAIAVVREGDEVTRGQMIAKPDGFMSVAIHAPASGVIRAISPTPVISGKMELAFFLAPFPSSTQEAVEGQSLQADRATAEQIIEAIQTAGVVGLGGAGFPTHAKLKVPQDKHVDTLLINGAECEPYLTTDHRVMLEHADDVMTGVPYLLKATGAVRAIIAVEANKQDAAEGATEGDSTGRTNQCRTPASEVSARRGEDADHGATWARGSLRRFASRRGRGVRERGHHRRDRKTATARHGTAGASDYGCRSGSYQEG